MSKGIDIPIDNLVTTFNSDLWQGKTNAFYGRVFRNERNNLISPEIWITPNDYIEVLKDDSKDGQCFFDVQPNITMSGDIKNATVWICFMLNLATVYPTLTRTEATQQAHLDTMNLILGSEFLITELVTGITGFTDYDFGDVPQAKVDMSPHYLFKFITNIYYTKC